MVDHLQHRTGHALRVEHEGPERHEAHMRDRGVGHKLLQVALHRRNGRAVEDRDHREREHDREEIHLPDDRERDRGADAFGEQRQREADEAVATGLQQDAREDDRTRRRRFDVGVGEPGVEREHRQLDREGQGEGDEGERLELDWEQRSPLEQLDIGQRALTRLSGLEVDRDDPDEHEQ